MIARRRPKRQKVEGDSAVGYGKPPKHTRFKPGKSGNPKGRPSGTSNFKTDVKAMLKALVKVTRDGKRRTVSAQEAMLLRLLEKALSGEPRAMSQLTNLAEKFNNDDSVASVGLSPDDAEILKIYSARALSGAAGPPDTTGVIDRATAGESPSSSTETEDPTVGRKSKIARVRPKRRTRSEEIPES